MKTLSNRLYERGKKAIERSRAENEQQLSELAERIARVEWLEQENLRLRVAVAKAARIIEKAIIGEGGIN